MSVCLMLLLLYMLIISQIRAETQNYPLNMVKSNNHLDDHCLSYYLRRHSICSDFCPYVVNLEQLVAYCLRSSDDNNSSVISNLHVNLTFGQLRQLNITSNILLSWSTSVEMAERYHIFLNNYSITSPENDVLFYNCTPPWFGPFCRYTTDYSTDKPFSDFVDRMLYFKLDISGPPKTTCYIHLSCQTRLFEWYR